MARIKITIEDFNQVASRISGSYSEKQAAESIAKGIRTKGGFFTTMLGSDGKTIISDLEDYYRLRKVGGMWKVERDIIGGRKSTKFVL